MKVKENWADDERALRQLGYEWSMSDGAPGQPAPAYVLHHYPYRDTGRILEVLTREHGRLTSFARGVRGAEVGARWQLCSRFSACCLLVRTRRGARPCSRAPKARRPGALPAAAPSSSASISTSCC